MDPPTASRFGGGLHRAARSGAAWLAAILAVLAAIYTLAGVVGLPLLMRRMLATWQSQVSGMQLSLDQPSFNPWTLTLGARRFTVRYQGRELLELAGLRVRVRANSLWRDALLLDELSLESVEVHLRWDGGGHFQFERLLPQHQRASRSPGTGPAWEIDHLQIGVLRVQIVDPAVGLAQPLDVRLSGLGMEHLGVLGRDNHGLALDLHGRSGGRPVWDLHWQGDFEFAPLSSTGHLRLTHVSLPWLDRTLGERWPARVRGGEAELDGDYDLSDLQGQRRLLLHGAALDVTGLELTGSDPVAPELSLRRLLVRVDRLDTLRHEVTGERLTLESPELLLHRNRDGELDLQRAMQQWQPVPPGRQPASPAQRPQSPPTPAWTVTWPLAELSGAVVRLDDAATGEWRLAGLALRLEDLRTGSDAPMTIEATGAGVARSTEAPTGRWTAHATVQSRSRTVQGDWRIEDLDLRTLNALPEIHAGVALGSGRLTAHGSLAGDLQDLARLKLLAWTQVQALNVQTRTQGEWSAERVEVAPLGWDGRELTAPKLESSDLRWTVPMASGSQFTGAQQELTVHGLSWDGRGHRARLRSLLARGGDASLHDSTQSVQLRWHVLELKNATADLAADRFALQSVNGEQWRWRGRHPWLSLSAVSVNDLAADVRRRKLELGTVGVRGGRMQVTLSRDGSVAPLAELRSLLRQPPLRQPTAAPRQVTFAPGANTGRPWDMRLRGVSVALDSLRFDDSASVMPALAATQIVLDGGAWSSTQSPPLQGHLSLSSQGGQLRWDGTLRPRPLLLEGRLAVQNLDLRPLQPLLARDTYASIDHGRLSLSGRLRLEQQSGRYHGHYDGSAQVGDAKLVDQRNGGPLLSWTRVSAPQMRLDWPGAVQIPRVDLEGLATSVTIQPDHRLNWESLSRPAPAAAPAPASAPASVPRAQPSPAHPATHDTGWPVRVEALSVKRSAIDFADESLSSPFHAEVHDLAGSIGPLATDRPGAWTGVSLEGSVNRFGRVAVTGRTLLIGRPLSAEATVHFSNIELPTLNPYAAELAGYRIDQGMLDLKLEYTLQNGVIQGDNHARIDQLELGPQVHKTNAPDLPLRAAIDVLRNADGIIDLDVPIQGNLSDPDIIMRDVVFDALRGTLVKALESPFTVLANLLGRDSETLRHISFAGGSAELTAAAREKLASIARALGSHPNLLLFIEPGYDGAADAGGRPSGKSPASGALRALAVRRAETIKAALVKFGAHPDHVYIDEPAAALAKDGTVTTTLEAKAR